MDIRLITFDLLCCLCSAAADKERAAREGRKETDDVVTMQLEAMHHYSIAISNGGVNSDEDGGSNDGYGSRGGDGWRSDSSDEMDATSGDKCSDLNPTLP